MATLDEISRWWLAGSVTCLIAVVLEAVQSFSQPRDGKLAPYCWIVVGAACVCLGSAAHVSYQTEDSMRKLNVVLVPLCAFFVLLLVRWAADVTSRQSAWYIMGWPAKILVLIFLLSLLSASRLYWIKLHLEGYIEMVMDASGYIDSTAGIIEVGREMTRLYYLSSLTSLTVVLIGLFLMVVHLARRRSS